MRKRLRNLLLAASLMTCTGTWAQSESNITDQIASMEFQQWSFSPDWYYYNLYWGTVIDMPWPLPDIKGWLPGLGVHDSQGLVIPTLPFVPFVNVIGDNYVNERWRQMTPLRVAATAEVTLQAPNVDDEREYWKKIFEKDALVYADRSTELPVVGAWSVTADERNRYSQDILNDLDSLAQCGSRYEQIYNELNHSYDYMAEELDIIRSAHQDNADKLARLQDANVQLSNLRDQVRGTLELARFLEQNWVKTEKSLKEQYKWDRGKKQDKEY